MRVPIKFNLLQEIAYSIALGLLSLLLVPKLFVKSFFDEVEVQDHHPPTL